MNSKILFFILISFSLAGCGVKAPPQKYPDTAIDSYIREYTGTTELSPEELERTKDKPATMSVEDKVHTNQIDPNTTTK